MNGKTPSGAQRCAETGNYVWLGPQSTASASGTLLLAQEARRKGGKGTSRASRAMKLAPAALRPVFCRLSDALVQVHEGELDPRVATAMASLAGAMVRVLTSGELEERVRNLEERAK